MKSMIKRGWLAVLCLMGCATGLSAQGFQNEIQVFTQDIQRPGEWGLDLHLNSILRGPEQLTADEAPFLHAGNSIAEFSLGLGPALEAGLYVPVSWGAAGHDLFAGPEVRLKWILFKPEGEEGVGGFAGANLGVAHQNRAFSSARTQTALTLIAGYQGSEWLFAVDPSLTWPDSGDQRASSPELGSSWKLAWRGIDTVQPGLEFYADHGPFKRLGKVGDLQQNLYATLDVNRRPWVFNVGLGRGLTPVSDKWTLKFIFEIPL